VTLASFVVVFLAVLIAPLILLGVAFVAFMIRRPRSERTQSSGPVASSGTAAHGFGAGTQ